jgi:hypothetical protein
VWGRPVRLSVRALTLSALLLLMVGSLVPLYAPPPRALPAAPAPDLRPRNGVAMSANYVFVDGVTVEANRDD